MRTPMTRSRRATVSMLAGLLSLALLASGCGMIAGSGTYEVLAQFNRTFNLFPGSPVTVLGINVGEIADIDVLPGETLVTVRMVIRDDVQLPADVNAIVIPDSLLGERYVQLDPPFTSGPRFAEGQTIPIERSLTPFEFDEVLEGLNRFVGGLDEKEVARLVDNLAEVLDGQGAELGDTIDAADAAIQVLRANDDKLIALASRLSDLNDTLNTRDEEIGELIEDFSSLARILADDRFEIDKALNGLLRVTDELGRLLEVNREDLQDDIATLAQVGRTAQRNLDQVSLLVLSQAELFRHAGRVVDRQDNMIPLLNHMDELSGAIVDSLENRLEGLCLAAGLDEATCEALPINELIGNVCLPLLPCDDPAAANTDAPQPTMVEALEELIRESPPEFGQAIVDNAEQSGNGLADQLQEVVDEVIAELPDVVPGLLGDGGQSEDTDESDGSLLEGGRP